MAIFGKKGHLEWNGDAIRAAVRRASRESIEKTVERIQQDAMQLARIDRSEYRDAVVLRDHIKTLVGEFGTPDKREYKGFVFVLTGEIPYNLMQEKGAPPGWRGGRNYSFTPYLRPAFEKNVDRRRLTSDIKKVLAKEIRRNIRSTRLNVNPARALPAPTLPMLPAPGGEE